MKASFIRVSQRDARKRTKVQSIRQLLVNRFGLPQHFFGTTDSFGATLGGE
jgi:hypothetical protein